MRPCILLSALWLCFFSLLAVFEEGMAQSLGDHQYTSADIEAGARLYAAECALCHGPTGDLVDGVDLRLGQFRQPLSDFALRQLITTGLAEARMPGFDFDSTELDSIVAFIRSGFDPDGIAARVGNAGRGRALFEGKGGCALCHRVNGRGPRTAPDLSYIGAIRTPTALQRILLDPETAILPINRPVRAVTRAGEIINGRRLNEDTYTVQLIDSEERLRSLLKEDLVEFQVSRSSTMEPTTLSSKEIADVIGYLLSLRGLQ